MTSRPRTVLILVNRASAVRDTVRRRRCAAFVVALWTAAAPARGQDAPAAIPPPPEQRTADCTAPTYATDALVCGDATLLETDRELVRLYDAAATTGVRIEGALAESSTDWLRRRSRCAFSPDHRACVVAAYRERMSVVQALLATRAGSAPLTVRCGTNSWRGRQVHTAAGLDAMVLSDETGRPVGVALAGAEGPDWRAFAGYLLTAGQRDLTLVRGNERQPCRLDTALGGLADSALRERVEAIDGLLARAKAARGSGQLDAAAFTAVVRWLRDEELVVHAEAQLRTFADPAMHNYWHRSRLKFPTLVEQELSRLPEPVD
jgi:hypothetical protein